MKQYNKPFLCIILIFSISTAASVYADDVLTIPVQLTVHDGKIKRQSAVDTLISEKQEVISYSGKSLMILFDGMINSETGSLLSGSEWISPQKLKEAGIEVTYNASKISSEIYIPPAIQPLNEIHASGNRQLPDYKRIPPAFIGASLPFYLTAASSTNTEDSSGSENTQKIYGFNLMPSLSAGKTLFSGDLLYENRENGFNLEDWEAAVSRDIAGLIRITAGTARIDPVGFQTASPVLGLGIEKREGIGGMPVLADRYHTEIEVETESTAEIFVNNNLVRSIRILPGRYEISNFPLVTGYNVVTIIITDIYGDTKKISGTVPHSPRIQEPGKAAWGASTGKGDNDTDLILSRGYLKTGFSNYFGTEVYSEGTEEKIMGGLTLLLNGRAGLIDLGSAAVLGADSPLENPEHAFSAGYSFFYIFQQLDAFLRNKFTIQNRKIYSSRPVHRYFTDRNSSLGFFRKYHPASPLQIFSAAWIPLLNRT